MSATSPRVARIVQWLVAWATPIAFIVTAFVLVNGRTTAVAEAVWIVCVSVQAFALLSVGVGSRYVRSDRGTKQLLVFAIVDTILMVATFSAMLAPHQR